MAIDTSITALVVSQLITAWSYEPLNSSQQTNSISVCPTTKQNFFPAMGKRDTRVSEPRCAPSYTATMAPIKVSHTNNQRDNSSDTVMPELKP